MKHETVRELTTGGYHWVGSHTPDCRSRGCEPHASIEEAQRCQYEYELANARECAFTTADECVECKAMGRAKVWTDKALELGGYIPTPVHLCDEHRTIEVLRKHTSPPVERWVS